MLQAMYEQAARSLVALGSAVESCISSYLPSDGSISDSLFTNGSHGDLKVAASVTNLQHKLASRWVASSAGHLLMTVRQWLEHYKILYGDPDIVFQILFMDPCKS